MYDYTTSIIKIAYSRIGRGRRGCFYNWMDPTGKEQLRYALNILGVPGTRLTYKNERQTAEEAWNSQEEKKLTEAFSTLAESPYN